MCAGAGHAVKHFRQRIRAFLDYTDFMVASGRCDPPWVTLAEASLLERFHPLENALTSVRCPSAERLGTTVLHFLSAQAAAC